MKRVTLKTTVAAIAITSAAAAWAQTDQGTGSNANVSADTDVSNTVDNLLEDVGDAASSTADEVGEAVDDTSDAIVDTAEDAYDSATDTADAATEEADSDVNADVSTDVQSDDGMTGSDTQVTADTQSEESAPDGQMADTFSGMVVADLKGQPVIEANGTEVGTVDHVIENAGQTEVVIGMGGFLGIGQHDVAVPLSQLTQGAEGTLQLSEMTEEELNLMPEVEMDTITELSEDQPI